MYIPKEDFLYLLVPKLKIIYPDILCDTNKYECFFTRECEDVKKDLQGTTIGFTLGREVGVHNGYQISLKIEDYLVGSHRFGLDSAKYCYFPIFTWSADIHETS